MDWLKKFPYKGQIAVIAIGLSAVVCACVFFLISVGAEMSVWKILAGISAAIGALCTLIGVGWCCLAVRLSRTDPDLYACEIDMSTTDATEMLK